MKSLAHLCARLSRLAYEDNPNFRNPRWRGMDQTMVAQFDCDGTQAFISTDFSGRLFLVFRGTEEIADIKADLRYVKVDFPGRGRVHAGFYTAFRKVQDDIAVELQNHHDKTWIFTGHSLGAALALLATATWGPDAVYLYGCPRVGNAAFVQNFSVNRFENRGDIVTRLPPPTSPLQIWHSLRHGRRPTLYRHAGKRVRLSGFGHRMENYEAATAEM